MSNQNEKIPEPERNILKNGKNLFHQYLVLCGLISNIGLMLEDFKFSLV